MILVLADTTFISHTTRRSTASNVMNTTTSQLAEDPVVAIAAFRQARASLIHQVRCYPKTAHISAALLYKMERMAEGLGLPFVPEDG